MLKMTKIGLELIPDPDIYIFLKKGRRGGISYISNRYSKANNKYLKSYDPKEESKHIIYLDANNVYGYAMSYNKKDYLKCTSKESYKQTCIKS